MLKLNLIAILTFLSLGIAVRSFADERSTNLVFTVGSIFLANNSKAETKPVVIDQADDSKVYQYVEGVNNGRDITIETEEEGK